MITKVNNPVLDLTTPGVNGALFSANIDMGGNRVQQVAHPPIDNFEAATKLYVDNIAATAGGGFFLAAGFGPVPWSSSSPVPIGWLLCDGEQHDPATYPDLFAAIGTTYNTGGENPGWFRVPDLRGRAPAGLDDMAISGSIRGPAGNVLDGAALLLGGTTGAEAHQLTIAELPSHDHGGSVGGTTDPDGNHFHTGGGNSGSKDASGGGNAMPQGTQNTGFAGIHSHTFSGTIPPEGGDTPHSSMQPTMFFSWIIKSDDSTVGFPGIINMGNNNIINMLDPVNPQDAATKNYVDTKIQNEAKYYDIAFFYGSAVFTAPDEMGRFPAIRQYQIPVNFGNSASRSGVAATGVSTFSIRINGGQIGTITYGGGSTTGSFSAGGPWTINPGDQLTVVALTADATLEDIGIVIEAQVL